MSGERYALKFKALPNKCSDNLSCKCSAWWRFGIYEGRIKDLKMDWTEQRTLRKFEILPLLSWSWIRTHYFWLGICHSPAFLTDVLVLSPNSLPDGSWLFRGDSVLLNAVHHSLMILAAKLGPNTKHFKFRLDFNLTCHQNLAAPFPCSS